jgi:hypothetical protein
MLEDPSAKTTIEEGKSTAVSGDVIPVETAKAKEEENEKKREKAKDEAERKVENDAATNIENGGDSNAATDSCTSDVSDMRICDAAAAGVISAHSPEAGENMPPSCPLSDPNSDVSTRDCNASNVPSEERLITSSLSEQVTIDLTQETAEGSDTTIIDLTAEPTTVDNGGTGTATAGLIIDLTTDPESAVSKSSSESSSKSRRSKRAPLAVYVPPRGRIGPPLPPASGATATKKTSAAESVLVPALPPSGVATEDAPGVDVTEQVIQGFPIPCNSWPGHRELRVPVMNYYEVGTRGPP